MPRRGALVLGLAMMATALPQLAMAQAKASGAGGAARPADCELTVDGKSRIKGACEFRATGNGGFQISGDDYFAYLSVVKPGIGEGSWNGDPKSTHAHVKLGQLRRDGACWVGPRARICARDLPPGKRQAVQATQAKGVALYPELASQACLGVEGPPTAGQAVTLRNCKPVRDKIFAVAADGTIGLDRHPELCLGTGGGNGGLSLSACTPASVKWKLAGSDATTIQSDAGQCLVIPQLDTPDAPFPYTVRAEACATAGDKAVKFFASGE